MTLKPLTRNLLLDWLTSFILDFPASRLVLPASEKEQMTPDTFGRILLESCRQLDLFGVSSRMSPDTLALDSQKFTEAYEIWVTKLRQDCLQRQSVERLTDEQGCLSWRTPSDDSEGGVMELRSGCDARYKLRDQVNWPTATVSRGGHSQKDGTVKPKLDQEVKNWPTVTAQDAANNAGPSQFDRNSQPLNTAVTSGLLAQDSLNTNGKNQEQLIWATPHTGLLHHGGTSYNANVRRAKMGKQLGLDAQCKIKDGPKSKKQLNPDWVEQLMGLNRGWTDLDYLEME